LTFIAGIDPRDLPRPLRFREAITCDPGRPDHALERLVTQIPRT